MKTTLSLLLLSATLALQTGCFCPSSETLALRDAALAVTGAGAQEQVELGLGRVTFGLAKLASKFLELPPEAKMVLRAVHKADCSVFELQSGPGEVMKILSTADSSMEKWGWQRLVCVAKENELVAVYIPKKMKSAHNAAVSVIVVSQRQLVCASGRGDLQEIVHFALSQAGEQMRVPPRQG